MEFVDYEGTIEVETDKAILIRPQKACSDEQIWIPKSVMGSVTYKSKGDRLGVFLGEPFEAIELESWWAKKEGLL